ncbi:MAG TPA: hypothetical protein VJ777_07065 [Mycobacterium sp.]|nr:hypothetical protein [Mycobacterium sp.]
MTPEARPRKQQNRERHATGRPTKDDAQVSHSDIARRVRDADRFALQLPVVGRVPIPRPDQLAFYGALAALVAVEMVEWPAAVAIGVGHALVGGRPDPDSSRQSPSAPE